MKSIPFLPVLIALALPAAAHAQLISFGLGGGTGIGERGGSSGGGHANLSLQVKAPVLPGVRADAYYMDAPKGAGAIALSVSAVFSAPVPIVTPYLVAGWGTYGIGGDSTRGGWNVGLGAKASVVVGPAVFVEVRRHDQMARDIVTVGIRF